MTFCKALPLLQTSGNVLLRKNKWTDTIVRTLKNLSGLLLVFHRDLTQDPLDPAIFPREIFHGLGSTARLLMTLEFASYPSGSYPDFFISFFFFFFFFCKRTSSLYDKRLNTELFSFGIFS